MPLHTFAQKALARGAGLDQVETGQVVDVRPDVVLSHDNTAAIRRIWQQFGQERVLIPERMAITLDHAVPAPTTKHAQNHLEIRQFVAEQGIRNFFEIGRGICHQVLSEEAIVRPGQVILGADSHTTHFGWLGAFGAGIGRSEVATLWATGELWLRVPESMRIVLDGDLPARMFAAAKEINGQPRQLRALGITKNASEMLVQRPSAFRGLRSSERQRYRQNRICAQVRLVGSTIQIQQRIVKRLLVG